MSASSRFEQIRRLVVLLGVVPYVDVGVVTFCSKWVLFRSYLECARGAPRPSKCLHRFKRNTGIVEYAEDIKQVQVLFGWFDMFEKDI